MKSQKSSSRYTSFQDVKALLESKSISLPVFRGSAVEDRQTEQSPESEKKLFMEAMQSVAPISRDNCVERVSQIRLPDGQRNNEDAETLSKLRDLVKYGTGFHILDTPEYIEGTGYNVRPEVARRLHRGDFSIQAHVDLHGLTANNAKEVFEKFLECAVNTGKRGVLIIHGRGLSSPHEPVLKKKIVEWLTRGPWRKWIVAYSSARLCDGGAGATYVLLRKRPVSKRLKIGQARRDRKS